MSKFFHLRMEDKLEQQIKEVAKCFGMNASEYVRQVLKRDIEKCTPVEIFAQNTKTGEKISLGYYYADQDGFTQAADEIEHKAWEAFCNDYKLVTSDGLTIEQIPFGDRLKIML